MMVLKFMELSIPILQIFWNKVEIALSASHIRDNTHLAMVLKFMELYIPILQIFWNKVEIALSVSHIRDNTHLADIRQNIITTHFNVLFRQDV
jgi:hypothetical protein